MSEAELMNRLERLERDNQRFEKLGMVAVLIAAALAAISIASCSSAGRRSGTHGVVDKITTREFDMLDSSGKVRVKIAMDCSTPNFCWPVINSYDQIGKTLTVIGAGTLGITGEKGSTMLLDNGIQVEGMSRGRGFGDIANLGVGLVGRGAALTLSGRGGMSVQLMGQSALPGGEGGVLNLMGKDGNSVYLESDSSMVEIA